MKVGKGVCLFFCLLFIWHRPLIAYHFQKLTAELEKVTNVLDYQTCMRRAMDELLKEFPIEHSSAQLVDSFYQRLDHCNPDFPTAGWDTYPHFIRAAVCLTKTGTGVENANFAELKYHMDVLSQENNNNLLVSLERAKIIPMRRLDIRYGYTGTFCFLPEQEVYYNTVHKYLKLEKEQLSALQVALEEIKGSVSKCIGSPWKVYNTRSWRTHPREVQHDPNGGWHNDGLVSTIYKIMIYPKGCSQFLGTTEFAYDFFPTGPKGAWMLFKNSDILHRAYAPLLREGAEDRLVIEISIMPSLETDTRPIQGGLLSTQPVVPWIVPPFED